MLIHLVADYGPGDLAFAEVIQRLSRLLPASVVVPTPVPAFDTVSAGFCAAQLALGDDPSDRLVFTNVAPRADHPDPRPENQGERLVAARCRNGVTVVGVNAEHCFSFLRDDAEIHDVEVPDAGSQFRSRDLFPVVVARLASGDERCLGDVLDHELVPAAPRQAVAYVDGYGNLKTTWASAPVASGERIRVSIAGASAVATVSDGTFDVPHGEMSFAPGSSGWASGQGRAVFYELLLRGGSAAARLGHPVAGAPVDVRPM